MLQVWVSRLCDSLSFRVCVTTLVFRLGDKFSFRVCVTNLVPAYVCQLWFPVRATRVFCDRYSLLRFDLRDEWREVTNLCDKSVWQMLWTRPCAGFVLSRSVWPTYFPFWRVYDSYSSWHSVWGFDLCLHVWRFFVFCDLRLCTNVMNASLVITLECLVLGRVVNKWLTFPLSYHFVG